MRILSWNVGLYGLRSTKRKLGGLSKLLLSCNADIICFQETKLLRGDLNHDVAVVDGWHSFFSFSSGKVGYSGTATFCTDRALPLAAEEGLTGTIGKGSDGCGCLAAVGGPPSGGYPELLARWSREELQEVDAEGRCVITDHGAFVLFNLYAPAITSDDPIAMEERFKYKMRFLEVLQVRVEAMRAAGRRVVLMGDFNISPAPIDSCDSGRESQFLARPDRVLLRGWMQAGGGPFVDVFRVFHPGRTQAYTCWSQVTSARVNNYGTRIDLILAADGERPTDGIRVEELFTAADISVDVEGSDHAPVWL
eukprot:jgi/Botrbrau1/14870/Bobra.0298s0004.1